MGPHPRAGPFLRVTGFPQREEADAVWVPAGSGPANGVRWSGPGEVAPTSSHQFPCERMSEAPLQSVTSLAQAENSAKGSHRSHQFPPKFADCVNRQPPALTSSNTVAAMYSSQYLLLL